MTGESQPVGRSVAPDERDRLAEEWLMARRSPEWYIGDATAAEWDMAYAATDRKRSDA